jgi:putative oxidoreductase
VVAVLSVNAMQRLFSTFPNSWPGLALLLLRVTIAAPLLLGAAMPGWSRAPPLGWSLQGPEALCGALLLLGAWMPLTCAAAIAIEIVLALYQPAAGNICATRAAAGLSLMLLGPGAWSVDAHLYGRQRLNI